MAHHRLWSIAHYSAGAGTSTSTGTDLFTRRINSMQSLGTISFTFLYRSFQNKRRLLSIYEARKYVWFPTGNSETVVTTFLNGRPPVQKKKKKTAVPFSTIRLCLSVYSPVMLSADQRRVRRRYTNWAALVAPPSATVDPAEITDISITRGTACLPSRRDDIHGTGDSFGVKIASLCTKMSYMTPWLRIRVCSYAT